MVNITKKNSQLYNWGLSRIGVAIKFSSGDWIELEIPNNVVINARNEQEIVDGLEQHNSGYVYKPQRFTFSLDINANTPSYRLLRETLLRRLQFEIRVAEDATDNPMVGGDYIREYEGLLEILSGCVFDDMSEPFRVGQLSVVTFNGKALRFMTNTEPDSTIIDKTYGDGTYDSNTPET